MRDRNTKPDTAAIAGACFVAMILIGVLRWATGCADASHLKPQTAADIEAVLPAACKWESIIPDVGGELSMLCPVEVMAVDAFIDAHTADAGVAKATARIKVRAPAVDGGGR